MNETRAGLEAVRRDVEEHMNNLGQRVNSVEDHLVDINKRVVNWNDSLDAKLDLVNANMKEELEAMRHQHKNQTSELSGLYTSFMNETRAGLKAVRRDVKELKTQTTSEVTGNAALLKLLPYMNRMEGNLQNRVNSLARDLEEVTEKVCNLTENVEMQFPIVKSNLTTLKETTTTEVRAVKRQLENCKNHTMSELETLHAALWSNNTDQLTQICAKMEAMDSRLVSLSSVLSLTAVENQAKEHNNQVTSTLVVLQTKQDAIDSKLNILDSKQDELDMKVMSVNSELEQTILTNITKQLKKTSESSHEALGPCGGEGWTRVAYLDMTDPNTNCPSGWRHNPGYPRRTCGKVSTGRLTCDSVFFPVRGGAYTSVCGRIKGYQNSRTDVFEVYHNGDATTIDEPYVSGVSLTHGSPRQHIWTFAASATSSQTNIEACPCNSTSHNSTPPFVGRDYFCESGANSVSPYGFHPDDPLWDGDSCAVNSTCCPFNNPLFFTKQLPNTTTDDLEVRLCWWDREDETPIELIELYVGFGEVNTKEPHHNVLINTQQLTDMICSKMERINVSMREEFRAVERQFQEHKNQTTSELSDLHTSLQSTHTDHLTQICDKMDVIDSRLVSVSSAINKTDKQEAARDLEEVNEKVCAVLHTLENAIASLQNNISEKLCEITRQLNTTASSLITEVQTAHSPTAGVEPTTVIPAPDIPPTDNERHVCGGTGGWRSVAYLNMSDIRYHCPAGWRLHPQPARGCGRTSHERLTCNSAIFPVHGGPYTKICGRVLGYQFGATYAFLASHENNSITINQSYVTGVSITRGNPRQHIWTYAVGYYERLQSTSSRVFCPCEQINSVFIPSFVGAHWYCESGDNSPSGIPVDTNFSSTIHCGMERVVHLQIVAVNLTDHSTSPRRCTNQ